MTMLTRTSTARASSMTRAASYTKHRPCARPPAKEPLNLYDHPVGKGLSLLGHEENEVPRDPRSHGGGVRLGSGLLPQASEPRPMCEGTLSPDVRSALHVGPREGN